MLRGQVEPPLSPVCEVVLFGFASPHLLQRIENAIAMSQMSDAKIVLHQIQTTVFLRTDRAARRGTMSRHMRMGSKTEG